MKKHGKCISINENNIYIYSYGKIIILENNKIVKKIHLFWWDFIFDLPFFRIISRLLRLGMISGSTSGNTLLIWGKKRYALVNIKENSIIKKSNFDKISAPLNVCPTTLNNQDCFIFGEYKSNPNRDIINICSLDENGISVLSQFKKGQIEHVHTVISITNSKFIICAGDFEHAASIWSFDIDSSSLNLIVSNNQKWRTGTGLMFNNKLYYPTDTTTEQNFLINLNIKTLDYELVDELPASTIYGCSYKDLLYFSTNIEASLKTKNTWKKWITRDIPDVFQTNKIHLYKYKIDSKLEEISKFIPSLLPYRLFQYPSLRLHCNEHYLVASGTSIKNLDNKIMIFKLKT